MDRLHLYDWPAQRYGQGLSGGGLKGAARRLEHGDRYDLCRVHDQAR
jgi:hypothetical protein